VTKSSNCSSRKVPLGTTGHKLQKKTRPERRGRKDELERRVVKASCKGEYGPYRSVSVMHLVKYGSSRKSRYSISRPLASTASNRASISFCKPCWTSIVGKEKGCGVSGVSGGWSL
jgi:hypothetical protein